MSATLTLALALRYAAETVPLVDPSTLIAFAEWESKLNPLVIHDNNTGQSFVPATAEAATALATRLMAIPGASLDLGIMQLNSGNLRATGTTLVTAFDPRQSMRAGGQILVEAMERCRRLYSGEQDALKCAASIYNTGKPTNGIANGYQANVWRVAAQLVPAIRTAALSPATVDPSPSLERAAPQPRSRPLDPTEPPAWDLSAHQEWRETKTRAAEAASVSPPTTTIEETDGEHP